MQSIFVKSIQCAVWKQWNRKINVKYHSLQYQSIINDFLRYIMGEQYAMESFYSNALSALFGNTGTGK